ncbi:regulatory protein RecX [Calditrichota bacterium]
MNFIIDKILPQKKSKNRFSIFSKDEFIIGISDRSLLQYNLHVGSEITQSLLTEIKKKEDLNTLQNAAFRFLARRQHSVHELKRKLFTKTSDHQLIEQVIAYLLENNYLNDNEFTAAFLNEEIKLKKSGSLLIKKKLLQKGVNAEIIGNLISSNYSAEDQLQNCQNLAFKKLNTFKNIISIKQKKIKLVNYLKQKGYDWETCKQAVMSLNLGENDEE